MGARCGRGGEGRGRRPPGRQERQRRLVDEDLSYAVFAIFFLWRDGEGA
jgi:hypothetical protein